MTQKDFDRLKEIVDQPAAEQFIVIPFYSLWNSALEIAKAIGQKHSVQPFLIRPAQPAETHEIRNFKSDAYGAERKGR